MSEGQLVAGPWGDLSPHLHQLLKLFAESRVATIKRAQGYEADGGDRASFARGRPLWMIICKRPAPKDDYLQEAGSLVPQPTCFWNNNNNNKNNSTPQPLRS